MQQCERLRKYNRWRRGDKRLKMPDPKELGELIDGVADRLEVLEREHSEFFERWHEHRRAIEAMVRVLGPAAPTCEGCAMEIAEALKIARKLGAGTTAPEGHNVEVTGSPALSASPGGLPGCAASPYDMTLCPKCGHEAPHHFAGCSEAR